MRIEAIIAGVVDAAKTQGRPHLVAFRGVVVNHVEDDFDAGVVQNLNHGLEFAEAAVGQIQRVRSVESKGVVSPVIPQVLLDEAAVVEESVHGKQFHRRHAQIGQMFDCRGRRQSREGPALVQGNIGVLHGEAANMQFVDDRLMPLAGRRAIVAPGERRIHHTALGHMTGVVAGVERKILLVVTDAVAEVFVAPLHGSR